jgi:predicted nucleotidyltransferase
MTLALEPRHLDQVRAILRRCLPGRAVVAFGSRVNGAAGAHSDLDLAVLGEPPLSLPALAAIQEEFSESDLPFKVDVVDLAAASEDFRKRVLDQCVVVQEAEG